MKNGDWFVEIVRADDDKEVVRRMGPMSEHQADKVDRGANINLNHDAYYTRIVVPVDEREKGGTK